jgi:hypothetical protein
LVHSADDRTELAQDAALAAIDRLCPDQQIRAAIGPRSPDEYFHRARSAESAALSLRLMRPALIGFAGAEARALRLGPCGVQ